MNHLDNKSKKKPRVFVSHTREDSAAARAIVTGLRLRNINVYNTDEIQVGQSWRKSIRDALSASDYFLYLVSKNSIESAWINAEFEMELKSRDITFFPIFLEDCQIPPFLTYQYFDIKNGIEESLDKLSEALRITSKIDFDKLSSLTFEQLIFELLEKLEFVISRSREESGIDAIAEYYLKDPFGTKTRELYAIKIKLYRDSRVDLRTLSQLAGYVISDPRVDKALVVTNGNLTSVALDWVKDSPVPIRVIEGTELKRLLLQNTDLVSKYFTPSLSNIS